MLHWNVPIQDIYEDKLLNQIQFIERRTKRLLQYSREKNKIIFKSSQWNSTGYIDRT